MGLMQGKKHDNIFFQYPVFKNCCLPYIKQNERRVIIQCGAIFPSYIPELANLRGNEGGNLEMNELQKAETQNLRILLKHLADC